MSLEFRFGAESEITGIYTPGRWGRFGGVFEQLAWEGRFAAYRREQGVLIPGEAEVGWYTDERWHAVWRGTIVSASFEFEDSS